MEAMGAGELREVTTSALMRERLVGGAASDAIVVDLRRDGDGAAPAGLAEALLPIPRVLVGVSGGSELPAVGTLAAAVDVVVADETAAGDIVARVAEHPVAAASLAMLLRGGDGRSVNAGLVAESSTYSLLQAGPDHARWLASRPQRERGPEHGPAVRVERTGARLLLTLARPHVRNAFDARTRDELLAGLLVAAADPDIDEVVLQGDGPSFCSGGDLDEFGTLSDPAAAHVLRVGRSVGRAVDQLRERVTCRVHGPCFGAGVELPAFGGRVVATADTTFTLPELVMGLVPGAGGTVSLPRRIGRHRTAWMALSGCALDAATALAWGLVDEVVPGSTP